MSERIGIFGATSSLAESIAHCHAARGDALTLWARNLPALEAIAADLRLRYGVSVQTQAFDLVEEIQHIAALDTLLSECARIYMCAGSMELEDRDDAAQLARLIDVTFTGPSAILARCAHQFAARRSGTMVVISSVAGDRGRASNYVYGSAKAGLTAFASGLRNRLSHSGAHVLTVRPGFIDTPMTWGMNSPLIADRGKVARRIVRAADRKKNDIYTPWFWRYIMLIIRNIPERIFKKLSL